LFIKKLTEIQFYVTGAWGIAFPMISPAAPNGGIAASLGQATGYQAEIVIAPRARELNPCPPPAD